MSRTLFAGVTLVAALAVAGAASAGLVLGSDEAPGLKARRASPAAGQRAIAAALEPARLPAPHGKAQASHFTRAGVELWSLAYVLPNAKAAATELRRLRRAARGERRARIGDQGYTLSRKGAVVVLWRRRSAVGELLLRTTTPQRANALAYAGVIDARMDHVLGLTAWTRTLEQIRPDGTVPRKTALDLFALAYGPLPGTRRPPGPADRVEGSMAGRLILQLWPKLSRAQRAAALKKLGLTSLRRKRVSGRPHRVTGPATFGDPGFTPLPGLTEIVEKYAAIYGAKLSHTLKLKIVAGTTSTDDQNGALADAYPVDENGVLSNAATYCRVRVPPKGQAITDSVFRSLVLAHETFHCFQFSIMTPEGALSVNRRNWMLEGMADWAAISVVAPSFKIGGGNYLTYLNTPITRLFERTYDAVGFFAHAEDATGDLWPRLPTVLKQPTSEDNFRAIGGDSLPFLNTWGGSTFNDAAKLGLDWTMTLPLTLPGYVSPDVVVITSSTGVAAQPFTFRRYRINIAPEIVEKYPLLHLTIKGFARLANHDWDTTDLEDRWFCLREKCECPKGQEGTPPPAPPLGESVTDLALSADERATSGGVTVDSLESYCKRKQKPPPPPPRGGGGGGGCGGCGGSNGDPHLHTFDNRFYDFQAAGEFILARSRTDRLELQARQEPFPGRKDLSINTAFAMRVAGDRVAVYRGDPLVVRVNGHGLLATKKPARLPHGGTIRVIGDQVAVKWPDGSWARVLPVKPWGINVLLKPTTSRFGTFTGLLGNFNGTRADDFVSRGGRRITARQYVSPAGFRLIYRVLGDSWRVKQRESLFDYARGQSTRTFTVRGFPHRRTTSAALLARQRRAALRACKRLHIQNPQILEDCTLDVGATGDNRFATGSRAWERTAGKFTVVHRRSAPPPPSGPETRWTPISKGGESNLVFGSLQHDGGKVVAAYLLRPGTAEAATFTPSFAADATGLRRDVITSGWGFLGSPFLLPRAGGGLQVLLSGIHSNNNGDPLNGTSIAARNPDGSFGAPQPTSNSDQAEVDGPGVLAPDGQPLWPSTWHSGLYLVRGATGAVVSDFSAVAASAGVAAPAVGRDALGRYWVAYRSLGKTAAATGLYLLQVNPATLQAVGSPRLAPSSGPIINATVITRLVCAKVCRVVYVSAPNRVVSWAYGEGAPTVVHAGSKQDVFRGPSSAYTAGGRLWTVWWNDNELRFEASFGNGAGAGGKPILLARPPGLSFFAGALTTVTEGDNLVVVLNWGSRGTFSRYVNVVRG